MEIAPTYTIKIRTPKNSAPNKINKREEKINDKIKNKIDWIGLTLFNTKKLDTTVNKQNIKR